MKRGRRRVNKRKLLKLAESSSSSAEDEALAIAIQPMNVAAPAKSAPKSSRPKRKGDYHQGTTSSRATREAT